jgi:hypothetical protein
MHHGGLHQEILWGGMSARHKNAPLIECRHSTGLPQRHIRKLSHQQEVRQRTATVSHKIDCSGSSNQLAKLITVAYTTDFLFPNLAAKLPYLSVIISIERKQ